MRLLVVEDEPDLQEMVCRSLRNAGYAVDAASDGDEGFWKAKQYEYDTIILDWMLPKRSGILLLKDLRNYRSTPVLLLTAKDAVQDRVTGLDSGADDYLVKPFELQELLARVRALIRRSAGQSNSTIEIGEISVDTASQVVRKAGEVVALTAREYALVELLAVNRGRLVSRTKLYTHMFDENDDTLSNLIEVHISNVRKKLGKDFITTRRGQGYVIDG